MLIYQTIAIAVFLFKNCFKEGTKYKFLKQGSCWKCYLRWSFSEKCSRSCNGFEGVGEEAFGDSRRNGIVFFGCFFIIYFRWNLGLTCFFGWGKWWSTMGFGGSQVLSRQRHEKSWMFGGNVWGDEFWMATASFYLCTFTLYMSPHELQLWEWNLFRVKVWDGRNMWRSFLLEVTEMNRLVVISRSFEASSRATSTFCSAHASSRGNRE